MVCFAIYGSFTNEAAISGTTYRTAGLPPGVKLYRHTRTKDGQLPFASLEVVKLVGQKNPQLLSLIEQSPECLVLQGEVEDPADLKYLRDCIGVVAFYADYGGVVVADVQQFKFIAAAEWRREFFEPDLPQVLPQVTILYSEEEQGGGAWFHTRGLRKFGRPDLSLHHVPDRYRDAVIDLCNRFIELQALGGRIPEGQAIRMKSLPDGLVCHHGGSLEDPDFNNVHVEIGRFTSEIPDVRY